MMQPEPNKTPPSLHPMCVLKENGVSLCCYLNVNILRVHFFN